MTNLWKDLAIDVGQKWLGWEGEIFLNEEGKKGTKVGRNFVYKSIALKTDAPLGSYLKVRVKGVGVGFLTADEI
jgi:hypothetical protein